MMSTYVLEKMLLSDPAVQCSPIPQQGHLIPAHLTYFHIILNSNKDVS